MKKTLETQPMKKKIKNLQWTPQYSTANLSMAAHLAILRRTPSIKPTSRLRSLPNFTRIPVEFGSLRFTTMATFFPGLIQFVRIKVPFGVWRVDWHNSQRFPRSSAPLIFFVGSIRFNTTASGLRFDYLHE